MKPNNISVSIKKKTLVFYTLLAMLIMASLANCHNISEKNDKDQNNQKGNKRNQQKKYSTKEMKGVSQHEECIYTGPSEERVHQQKNRGSGGRLLQASAQRNMQILSYFPIDDFDGVNDGLILSVNVSRLQTNYKIATQYYSTIIKVFPFPQTQNTKYTGSCGTIPIPAEIGTNGFNVSEVDTVILTVIYSDTNTSSGTLAFAGPCQFIRRPVISQINYRAQKMNGYLTGGDYNWHQLVLISIHQMGHIFGMLGGNFQNSFTVNGVSYSRVYVSPTSDQRRRNQEIIATINGQAIYNKLPLVKAIVDNLFKCNEAVTGAKMTSTLGHWDGVVWLRELMTPTIGTLDNRISDLTLSLFYETGWYAGVEISKSWKINRGFNKGCAFMKGINNTYGDNCNTAAGGSQCDLYYNFGGICTSTGEILRSTSKTCSINTPLTRCFQRDNDTSCIQAICDTPTSVKVTLNAEVQYCNQAAAQQQLTFSGVTYKCPQDYAVFCAAQTCENWCSSNGVCINGICNFVETACQANITGCQFCSSANRGVIKCDQCQEGLILEGNACIQNACSLILGCKTCAAEVCTACLGDRTISSGKCTFQACGTRFSNCATCTQAGNLQTCNSCNQPYTLVNGICQFVCDIPNCQTCSISGALKICSTCNGDWIKQNNVCVSPLSQCKTLIANCSTCTFTNNDLNCATCLNGRVPSTDGQSCIVAPLNCSTIANCATCSLNINGVKVCNTCKTLFALLTNGTCFACPKNCQVCAANGNASKCTTCKTGFKINNKGSCVKG